MPTKRSLKDALLNVSKYLPAAAAANQSPTIDLGSVVAGEPKLLEIEVSVPALPNNTDNTKTITLRLQDSADDVTYADVGVEAAAGVGDAPRIECRLAGVTTTGSVAKIFRVALPSTARRYLQFTQTVASGGGDNTAALVTYEPCL
jgi:hypothetical protein